MLLGGGSNCQGCGCVPCTFCARTCTEPHTGDAFEIVYTRQRSFSTDENLTDGYLAASGDYPFGSSPTGMPGSAPWQQNISGTFILGGSSQSSRFPCSVRVSVWRTTTVLAGPGGGGTPSTALTVNEITVNVSYGAVVLGDGRVVTSADGPVAVTTVPLFESSNDPRTNEGTVSVVAECDNVETMFSIQATVKWTVSNRQHRLFGIARECYEIGTPCATFCSGSAPPNVVYLTISNYTGPTYDSPTPMDVEGTYILERAPGFCSYYYSYWNSNLCFSFVNPLGALVWAPIAINSYGTENHGFYMAHYVQIAGFCGGFELFPPDTQFSICGSGVLFSGTNGRVRVNGGTIIENAFDWEIEV